MPNSETSCAEIGRQLNAMTTQTICYNFDASRVLSKMSGEQLEVVNDYNYIGSVVDNTQLLRKKGAFLWHGHHTDQIWKSDINPRDKYYLFAATIDSVLTHGLETWTKRRKQL